MVWDARHPDGGTFVATIDLAGGLDAAFEYALHDHPRIKDMREGVSVWVYDDRGRFGFPRVALEATGPDWDPKQLQVNVAFPDGRVLIGSGQGPAKPSEDADGRLAVFAGGPLEFRCLEPFRRWTVDFDGPAIETTSRAQIQRAVGNAPTRRLRFNIDVTMAAPPWIQGQMSAEAGERLDTSDAIFVGGPSSFEDGMRYEQLIRTEGTLSIDEERWSFTGPGLRIHRQGLRNLTGFTGHVWQSALFPSGRGFGYMWLLPNHYKEGYLFDGGRMIPARVVETSWMTEMVPSGEDVSFVLESELGRTAIEAETVQSVFIPEGEPFPTEGSWPLHWQQAGVRFRWDGEETYGMMERSSLPEVVTD
jgi:hypothetical protein